MTSRTTLTLLALASLLVTAPVLAGKVYQWKDAKGVTHYSDSPPPERKGVQNRQLKDPIPTDAAQTKAAEEPNCVTARSNLAHLKGAGPVGLDADGDGKLDKVMSADERTVQIQQTELMLKTYCDKPAKS